MSVRTFTQSKKITPGTKVLPGRGVFIACDGDARVRLILSDKGYIESKFFDGPNSLENIAVVDCQIVSGTADVYVIDGPMS